MLAESFLSAETLNLSPAGRRVLIDILHGLETGEIADHLFSMEQIGEPECGTAGCFLGWAMSLDPFALPSPKTIVQSDAYPGLRQLCFPEYDNCPLGYKADRKESAQALRNFLTTGQPLWNSVMLAVDVFELLSRMPANEIRNTIAEVA